MQLFGNFGYSRSSEIIPRRPNADLIFQSPMPLDSEHSSLFEIAKWAWATVLAPAFGWIARGLATKMAFKRRRKALLVQIKGLPPEAKSILRGFYENGCHTMAGNSDHPGIAVLLSLGMGDMGPSRRMDHTTHCYFTIRPDVWAVVNDERGNI